MARRHLPGQASRAEQAGQPAQVPGSRSAGPDQLKAILLILVVFGHTYAEGVGQSFTKWLIYGFHMPPFLFLSGYLLRAERLRQRDYPRLLSDYARRMLAPWLIVSALWAATFGSFSLNHPVRSTIELLTLPQWHLWYVPVLFAMISLAWLAVRLPRPHLLLALVAAAGWLAWGTPLASQIPHLPEKLVDARYFSYLIWFVAGFAARNVHTPRARPWLLVPGALGAMLYVGSYQGGAWPAAIGFLVLNLSLVAAVPSLLSALSTPVQGWLVFMGQQSLWVYLFHPFVTRPLQQLALPGLWQRAAGLLLTAAICGVVAVLHRRSVIDLREPAHAPAAATVSS
ncbi:acyltransferase [Kineosporia sp. J2-2]|uniref:Acyltransferase n=1 Tax=Kineosporia corallincola TaxID=2835133 RepID=A0ABS5TEC1_9ACTN|nr:acyltransferase [Kineosporia corallincola]MBT0769390.1 acyltransferase [Kineosporia corallincola]